MRTSSAAVAENPRLMTLMKSMYQADQQVKYLKEQRQHSSVNLNTENQG
jgi:hypothetical protein